MSRAGATANVVLIHGGFVDGSGWQSVHRALTRKGCHVSVVQNPTVSLADDVAYTRRAIAEITDARSRRVGPRHWCRPGRN